MTPAVSGSSTARTRRTAARPGPPGRAPPGISTRTRCARSVGRPATPPAFRSCPGLVRYDEVAAGEIDHVIRFTAPERRTHTSGRRATRRRRAAPSDPPMGAWLRLKASYDISGFSAQNQVILRALKKHGMVLADNGSPFFMSGVPDPGWNDSDLERLLKTIPGLRLRGRRRLEPRGLEHSYAVAGHRRLRHRLLRHRNRHRRASSSPTRASRPVVGNWRGGNSRTALARTCAVAHAGSCSAELRRTRSSGDTCSTIRRTRSPRPLSGATYAASAWVRAPAGRSVTLRLRELNGARRPLEWPRWPGRRLAPTRRDQCSRRGRHRAQRRDSRSLTSDLDGSGRRRLPTTKVGPAAAFAGRALRPR